MSAEGESWSSHAVVSTDAPGTASTVDNSTNKHVGARWWVLQPSFVKLVDLEAGKDQSICHQTLPSQSRTLKLPTQMLKEYEK